MAWSKPNIPSTITCGCGIPLFLYYYRAMNLVWMDITVNFEASCLVKCCLQGTYRITCRHGDINSRPFNSKGMVQGAEVVKKEYLSDGTVEITMQMDLRGGFSQLVLPAEIKPLDSIKPEIPLQSSSAVYTGLVVDARGLHARPAMSPKVQDESGQEVYGSAFVSREYAVQQGMSGYAKNVAAARTNQRVTDNPLLVKGLRGEGAGHSDIVISNADASVLRSASENLSFMKKCRVMIVVD